MAFEPGRDIPGFGPDDSFLDRVLSGAGLLPLGMASVLPTMATQSAIAGGRASPFVPQALEQLIRSLLPQAFGQQAAGAGALGQGLNAARLGQYAGQAESAFSNFMSQIAPALAPLFMAGSDPGNQYAESMMDRMDNRLGTQPPQPPAGYPQYTPGGRPQFPTPDFPMTPVGAVPRQPKPKPASARPSKQAPVPQARVAKQRAASPQPRPNKVKRI